MCQSIRRTFVGERVVIPRAVRPCRCHRGGTGPGFALSQSPFFPEGTNLIHKGEGGWVLTVLSDAVVEGEA